MGNQRLRLTLAGSLAAGLVAMLQKDFDVAAQMEDTTPTPKLPPFRLDNRRNKAQWKNEIHGRKKP